MVWKHIPLFSRLWNCTCACCSLYIVAHCVACCSFGFCDQSLCACSLSLSICTCISLSLVQLVQVVCLRLEFADLTQWFGSTFLCSADCGIALVLVAACTLSHIVWLVAVSAFVIRACVLVH